MFKYLADADTIIAIYEGLDKDFDQTLQRCFELFGEGADMPEKASKLPQEFADDKKIDSEESEGEEDDGEEAKISTHEHI